MQSVPITSWQIEEEKVEAGKFSLHGLQKSLWMVTSAMKLRYLLLGRKAMTNLNSILKQGHHFANKDPCSKSYSLSSSHVQCESSTIKMLSTEELLLSNCGAGKTLESPLNSKEIKPVNPKRNQN